MQQKRWIVAASTAMMLMLAVGEGVATAGPKPLTPLACTGIPAQGSPPPNHGAGSTQCETTTPQPFSNADATGHGANTTSPHNPYLATGFGQVQGGHLAGTVGKADNKFPPGQAPNGTDANHGYECDQNPGIGNGNPAHTTCRAVSTPPTVTPPPPTTPPPSETPPTVPPSGPPTVPPGTVTVPTPAVLPEAATATVAAPIATPAVLPEVATATVGAPASAVPSPTPAAGPELAFTGAASRLLAALAFALIALGGALLWLARRTASAS